MNPPGGGGSLSFQKGVPFLWPLFVWFDIAQLRVARHADMDTFAISNSEGRRDHRGLERRLFRAVDAAKSRSIKVNDPANRRLDDVVDQVSHQPSDLRIRANRPRRRTRMPSRLRPSADFAGIRFRPATTVLPKFPGVNDVGRNIARPAFQYVEAKDAYRVGIF